MQLDFEQSGKTSKNDKSEDANHFPKNRILCLDLHILYLLSFS